MSEVIVKNRGSVPASYAGVHLLPGKVKAFPEEAVPELQRQADIIVLGKADRTSQRRVLETEPPAAVEAPVVEEVIPLDGDDVEEDKGSSKPKRKKRRSSS